MKRHLDGGASRDLGPETGFVQVFKKSRASAKPVASSFGPPPAAGEAAGEVFVLGQGDCGQLGRGEDFLEAKLLAPSPLPGGNPLVRSIAAGGVHSLAVAADGAVFSTGVNDEGALGRRTDNKIWEKEGAALAAEPSGSDFDWGRVPVPASHGTPVAASAGDSHSAVLTDSGAIWGWGTFRDAGGVYGFSPDARIALLPALVHAPEGPDEAVRKVVSGTDHMLALTAGGQVLSWGTGWQGQLGRVPPSAFAAFTAAKTAFKRAQAAAEAADEPGAAAGPGATPPGFRSEQAAAQRELRAAKAAFDPQDAGLMRAQLLPARVPLPFRSADVFAGWYTSFAVDSEGQLWAFGLDNYGQATAAPKRPEVDKDERFLYEPEAVQPLAGERVRAAAPGIHHSVVATAGGRVLAFGRTTYGRLGRLNDAWEANEPRERPLPVDGLPGVAVAAVAAGEMVSGCVSACGRAFLWGCGTNAQLGNSGRRAGLRNAGLPEAEGDPGEEDADEVIPCRLDAHRLAGRRALQLEFGGQHALLLVSRPA